MVGESSKKTFIFDLDDTLMRTQHYYDFARMKFNTCLIKTFGEKCPSMDNLNKEYIELYISIIEQNGFSRLEQVPETMVKYYALLSERLGARFSQKTANEIYQIGWSAVNPEIYKKKAKLLSGAEETLEFLLAKHDEMFIYTRGNDILQNTKIDALKLRNWCSQFYIVSTKDEETFRKIVGERKKENCYSVGDSKKSDIDPAIIAGIKAIWIPYGDGGWAYDAHTGEKKEGNGIIIFKELLDIKRNYEKL